MLPECELGPVGSPTLVEYKIRVQPSMFGLSSAMPFEYLASEAVTEVCSGEISQGSQVHMFVEDARGGHSEVKVAKVVDECMDSEAFDDSNLSRFLA